jgi:hypothetical protein
MSTMAELVRYGLAVFRISRAISRSLADRAIELNPGPPVGAGTQDPEANRADCPRAGASVGVCTMCHGEAAPGLAVVAGRHNPDIITSWRGVAAVGYPVVVRCTTLLLS